jgi:hypothetical protein
MNEKVRQALQSIVQRFENGDIPEVIAYSTFPIPNIPATKWSLLIEYSCPLLEPVTPGVSNSGIELDAMSKGSQGFHNTAPKFIKKQAEDGEEEKVLLVGFLAVYVFRVEDTEGSL